MELAEKFDRLSGQGGHGVTANERKRNNRYYPTLKGEQTMTDLPVVRLCIALLIGILISACGEAPQDSAVTASSDSVTVSAPVARTESVEDVFFDTTVTTSRTV